MGIPYERIEQDDGRLKRIGLGGNSKKKFGDCGSKPNNIFVFERAAPIFESKINMLKRIQIKQKSFDLRQKGNTRGLAEKSVYY